MCGCGKDLTKFVASTSTRKKTTTRTHIMGFSRTARGNPTTMTKIINPKVTVRKFGLIF